MKKTSSIFLLVILLLGISSLAFATGPAVDTAEEYEIHSPDRFRATGFVYLNPDTPLKRIQNLMDFDFFDGEECERLYTVSITGADETNPEFYKMQLYLTYNSGLLRTFDSYFISGTFFYYQEVNHEVTEISGEIIARHFMISPETYGFAGKAPSVPAIMLDFTQPGSNAWNWNAFLTTPDNELVSAYTDSYVTETADYYMEHEERPHIPRPSTQADVAAGVGLTTVGVALANTLTKTSIFGNASFNGSFNPSAPAPPPTPTSPAPANSSGGGFFGVIKDFFKNLFDQLREMLTDEGRSYASGKLSENLENILPIDIEKE